MAYLNLTQSQRDFWKKYAEKNIRTGVSNTITPGKMYFFNYSSKGYEEGTLPYYDQFPIVLVIDVDSKYILGLAFHYLPRQTREYFIKKIILNNFKLLKKEMPARVPYEDIKNASNLWYREGMVIIRKYIRRRIKSKVVELHWKEWYNAMNTEGAQWIDATAELVYRESKYRLQGARGMTNRTKPPKAESAVQKRIKAQKEAIKREKNRYKTLVEKNREKFKRKK